MENYSEICKIAREEAREIFNELIQELYISIHEDEYNSSDIGRNNKKTIKVSLNHNGSEISSETFTLDI